MTVDVNTPGFSRLYHDVYGRPRLALVRPMLRVLPGGRSEPARRGCGRRTHLHVVATTPR